MFSSLRDDLREAFRRVRRNPRLTLLAVGTLALGIGAATAVFTMAHTVLYAPPPFRAPDRIVSLDAHQRKQEIGVSNLNMRDYRDMSGAIEAAALTDYAEFSWTGQSLPGFDGSEVLRGMVVTDQYFRVFDHRMALGRGFASDEGRPGSHVVVISYSLWQRRFAGRPDVLGQTMTLNGEPHTIVGVAGPRFLTYESYEVLAWSMLQPSTRRDSHQYSSFARLRPDVTLEQAQRRLDIVGARLAREYPDSNKDYSVTLTPLLTGFRAEIRPAFLALVGAVACLLLIAAANVASLLLARATTEAREMAIRTALGASRSRLARMIVAHSLVLALIASAGGAVIGAWLLAVARGLMPVSLQFDWAFAIDWRVFVVALLVSAVAGLAAGLAPAFESFRLAAGGLRVSFHRSRLLRAIVTVEVALAVFLSIGAGLLGKSFVQLITRPLGYDTAHLLGMRVRLQGERYKTSRLRGDYWVQLVERAGALPGVAKAASVTDLPMGWQYNGGGFEVEGYTFPDGERAPTAHYLGASPGYFATLGIPILAGRGVLDSDGPDAEKIAIVNDLMASKFWPGRSAIGGMVRVYRDWRRVVGVVRGVRHGGPHDENECQIYMPSRQFNSNTMFLVVRGNVPPDSLVPSIRGVLKSIDPTVPAFEIRTLDQAFTRETAKPRLPMVLTASFAVAATILAGLGLFGVIVYWVSQRAKELGIRSALGARPGELRRLVLGQGARLMTIGVVLGATGALWAMQFVRSQLYGMSERDGGVYAGAIGVAVVTTLLACWLPAIRAGRVDPAVALREE